MLGFAVLAVAAIPAILLAQDTITTFITQTEAKPALAVTDFRGSGSQQFMAPFNSTLFSDLDGSGLFDMKAKSVFPLNNPQRPEDLRPSDNNQGFALADWSGTPVSASHLVFGYTAAQNGAAVALRRETALSPVENHFARLTGQHGFEALLEIIH